MALALLTTKDMRCVRKQQRPEQVGGHCHVNLLQEQERLPADAPASVTRGWAGHWDCQVEPDWLLPCKLIEKELTLVRTGSLTELFG